MDGTVTLEDHGRWLLWSVVAVVKEKGESQEVANFLARSLARKVATTGTIHDQMYSPYSWCWLLKYANNPARCAAIQSRHLRPALVISSTMSPQSNLSMMVLSYPTHIPKDYVNSSTSSCSNEACLGFALVLPLTGGCHQSVASTMMQAPDVDANKYWLRHSMCSAFNTQPHLTTWMDSALQQHPLLVYPKSVYVLYKPWLAYSPSHQHSRIYLFYTS